MDGKGVVGQELGKFIEEYVDSFVKWDLVTFFSFNPDDTGTADELAARLGRKKEDIKEALDDLAERNLLKCNQDNDKIYSFSPSDELKGKVDAFCSALEDRDKRLEILAKLLRMKATH